MSKPAHKRFVFNDETVANSYGFYISTMGIDLTRFEKNPVMLSDHWNHNHSVLGKWTALEKKGTTLSGVPEFDTEDEAVKITAGKVARGYINGCSMGIVFNPQDMVMLEGKVFLTKCELAEVSIVPVPSNANAVRLMYEDGVELSETEIKSLCLSVAPEKSREPEKITKPQNNMKKIILSLACLMALSYKEQPVDGLDVSEVEGKILDLAKRVETLSAENQSLKAAAQAAQEAQVAALKHNAITDVELAIAEGKITADKKEAFVQLGITNPEVLKATLSAIPAKQNFAAGVTTPQGTGAVEVKTKEDFLKLGLEAQMAFKAEHLEDYKKLFS